MNYRNFCDTLGGLLAESIPDDCYIQFRQLSRDGDKRLSGILTIGNGEASAPGFSLPEYYEKYLNGTCLRSIEEQIRRKFLSSGVCGLTAELKEEDPALLKSRICFKLIGSAGNAALLRTLPHRSFLDLSVVYELRQEYRGRYLGSMLLDADSAARLELCEEELYALALHNTPEKLPFSCVGIMDVLEELKSEVPAGFDHRCALPVDEDTALPMYVLTNSHRFCGAAVLLYPGVQEALLTRFGEYLLLPSSIHEWILVPDRPYLDPEDLKATVREINRSMLDRSEILSDNVYRKQNGRALTLI